MNSGMIELTCSGNFRSNPGTDKDRQPFNNVKVTIPACDEEYYVTFAQRMFPIARLKDKSLTKINFEGLIKLYIDEAKPVDGVPACVGKDIKHMTWEELQEMACCLKLREIPHYQSGDIRKAREVAYETYMKVIKKKKILKNELDYKVLEEKIRRKYERSGLEEYEVQEEIDKVLNDAFDMRQDANNPMRSYNFAKLKPLIAVKEWGKEAPKEFVEEKV